MSIVLLIALILVTLLDAWYFVVHGMKYNSLLIRIERLEEKGIQNQALYCGYQCSEETAEEMTQEWDVEFHFTADINARVETLEMEKVNDKLRQIPIPGMEDEVVNDGEIDPDDDSYSGVETECLHSNHPEACAYPEMDEEYRIPPIPNSRETNSNGVPIAQRNAEYGKCLWCQLR